MNITVADEIMRPDSINLKATVSLRISGVGASEKCDSDKNLGLLDLHLLHQDRRDYRDDLGLLVHREAGCRLRISS